MKSVWSEKSNIKSFPSLQGDKKTDVLIIGGGMAGVLCAHRLSESGVGCILLESQRLGGGVTKNTTAKITSQHGMIYAKLIKSVGLEKTQMYLRINERAVEKYREICRTVSCGFEDKDNIVYSVDDIKKVDNEIRALELLGHSAEFADRIPVPVKISGAVRFKNQAQFNPLQFISAVSAKLDVYENTQVFEIRGSRAITEHGSVYAEKIIVATHFPFFNKFGLYPMKMYQERSYVIALENGAFIDGMYVDEDKKGMSFRNYENLLLVGGGDHRTGKQGGSFNELRAFAKLNYPALKEKYHWATQDCMTFDSVPYIGRYSKRLADIYVATGFNKWGMTSSMAASEILCDMVMGRKNDCAPVFSPSRNFIKPQLAVHAGETVINLLTPAKKRCPHLGCALKWNSAEHTWDCPCHGSRFSENGRLIDNPATGDLK